MNGLLGGQKIAPPVRTRLHGLQSLLDQGRIPVFRNWHPAGHCFQETRRHGYAPQHELARILRHGTKGQAGKDPSWLARFKRLTACVSCPNEP